MAASVSRTCFSRTNAQPSSTAPTVSAASWTIVSARCVYLSVVSGLRCPSSFPIARMVLPCLSARLAWRVPQIVKAHAAQVRFRTDPAPEPVQPLRAPRAVPLRGLKDPWAGSLQCIENAPGRLRQPHGSGACLAVAEEQMALAVIRPAQRQDLALAASRKQEKADDRNLPWSTVRMGPTALRTTGGSLRRTGSVRAPSGGIA